MLVTGASRGIGAAVARLAAGAGYTVVVNYAANGEAAAAVVDEIGNDSFAVQADVGVETAVLAMFADIDERCGRLDVLVNNAGIAGSFGTLDTYTAEALARLWAVNLTGPFLCAREAAARMRDSGRGGSIVNISSKAAVLGGTNEWVHYARVEGRDRHDDGRPGQRVGAVWDPGQRGTARPDRERLPSLRVAGPHRTNDTLWSPCSEPVPPTRSPKRWCGSRRTPRAT
jgi:nucleoside-diphosphate-sugar epimerase